MIASLSFYIASIDFEKYARKAERVQAAERRACGRLAAVLICLARMSKRRQILGEKRGDTPHHVRDARPAGKGVNRMDKEDLRRQILDCVEQNGPERAKEILYARLGTDPEFMAAAAMYGIELIEAMRESEKSRDN